MDRGEVVCQYGDWLNAIGGRRRVLFGFQKYKLGKRGKVDWHVVFSDEILARVDDHSCRK